jgi:hypothetical protein
MASPSDNFLLSAIVHGNSEVVALLLEDDTPHPWDVLFLRGCGVAAAWQGSAEVLQTLYRSPRARHHLRSIEDEKALKDLDAFIPDEPVLLRHAAGCRRCMLRCDSHAC